MDGISMRRDRTARREKDGILSRLKPVLERAPDRAVASNNEYSHAGCG
jgi:hypothetical protein